MGITGEPGVYWIGVHALGSNADGRDLVADGRARTFIPLVTKDQAKRTVDVVPACCRCASAPAAPATAA